MIQSLEINFSLTRAERKSRQNKSLIVIAVLLTLQICICAIRFQYFDNIKANLLTAQAELVSKRAQQSLQQLNPEQAKMALSINKMFSRISIPWESLMGAIEGARSPSILIEGVLPHPEDGSATISLTSQKFEDISEFTQSLENQSNIKKVTLVSESLPQQNSQSPAQGQSNSLKAVISVQWASTK